MKDREILTLDPGGTVRTLVLVDEHEHAHQLIIRGDPPVRFVHDGRAWCATGDMIQPRACPLSYEYRPAEDIT